MAENLMSMTQNFMTPDFMNKFSGALGQPSDKIQSGLKSVIPTLIMGLVTKGSTKEGAEGIVKMVNRQGLDSAETPSDLNDEGYLRKGNEVINGVFGNNLNSVVSGLGSSTGMSSSSITKMLGMVAPLVMGVVGSKIKREGMSASNVQGFLNQQKSSVSNLLPQVSSNNKKGTRPDSLYVKREDEGKKRSWGIIAVLALLGLGLLLWISRRNATDRAMRIEAPLSEMKAVLKTVELKL